MIEKIFTSPKVPEYIKLSIINKTTEVTDFLGWDITVWLTDGG